MRGFTTQLVRYLSTVANHRTDGDLLAGFLIRNAEADFTELVRRHGPMVWGVCRRALPDLSDAEDAFQTAFMVLVQRGNRLVGCPSIGPWLHRVAVWTTRNVHRRNARQLAKRVTLPEQPSIRTADVDLSLDLDAALLSLPEKYRSSIVLCHLLGFSRAEAAAHLGCAERTLSSWLSRGLSQLRQKLRGLDPTRALGVAAVAVPVGLSDSVVRAAISLQTPAIAASVLSSTVSQLVEGVIRMFWVKKATAATVSLFTVFAFGVGIGVSTSQLSPAVGGQEKVAVSQPVANADPASESEMDTKIALLEKEIAERTKALRELELKQEMANLIIANLEKANQTDGSRLKEIESNRVALAQLKLETTTAAINLEKLRAGLTALQTLKAQRAKVQAPPASRIQKEMMEKLEKQEVQIEGDINDMSLFELLTLLSKKYDITFVIAEDDFKAEKLRDIKEKKLKLASPKLKGLKMGAFLDLVLLSIDATYIVRPDYVEITTIEKRLKEKVTRVFPEDDKVAPLFSDDADKKLAVLKMQLLKLQEDSQVQSRIAREKSEALNEQIRATAAAIAALQKQKEKEKTPDAKGPTAAKASGAYLQLTLGTKDATWPFQVTEFSADGKSVGTIAFTNADVFGRYLIRTMKDATGPKELRITARADMPSDLLISAIEMSKAAGFKDIVVVRKETNGTVADPFAERQKEKALLEAKEKALADKLREKQLEETIKRDPVFAAHEEAVARVRKALMDAEALFVPGSKSPQLLKLRDDLRAAEEKRDRYYNEARAKAEPLLLLKDEVRKLKEEK